MRDSFVVCFCAAWCGTCRDFQQLFDVLGRDHPQATFRWIDIEDEPEWLGDLDLETFPALVILRDGAVRFAGAVPPVAAPLARLIGDRLSDASACRLVVDEWEAVGRRLWAARVRFLPDLSSRKNGPRPVG